MGEKEVAGRSQERDQHQAPPVPEAWVRSRRAVGLEAVTLPGVGVGGQEVRFPTADLGPELWPKLSHQLSCNWRAKIEQSFGPVSGPRRTGTGPLSPGSEDARTGLSSNFHLPFPAGCPQPQPSILGAPPPPRPGSQISELEGRESKRPLELHQLQTSSSEHTQGD